MFLFFFLFFLPLIGPCRVMKRLIFSLAYRRSTYCVRFLVVGSAGRKLFRPRENNKQFILSEALQGMAAPGAGLRGVNFFRSKNRRRPKIKGLRRKISGLLVQMRLGIKKNDKTRSLPQIRGVMVLHHNMVSPQNGYTRVGRPSRSPSDATAYYCVWI